MTTEPDDALPHHAPRTLLEEEMAFGIKRRERFAWLIAGGGTLIGVLGLAAVVLLLPLKRRF
jgi:type IV secretion system protein VirB8